MDRKQQLTYILTNILNKKPGRRFIFAYSKLNKYISGNLFVRIVVFLLGLLLTSVGLVMLFLPGPGLLFILIGIILLCTGSRRIAGLLDKLESSSRKTNKK